MPATSRDGTSERETLQETAGVRAESMGKLSGALQGGVDEDLPQKLQGGNMIPAFIAGLFIGINLTMIIVVIKLGG